MIHRLELGYNGGGVEFLHWNLWKKNFSKTLLVGISEIYICVAASKDSGASEEIKVIWEVWLGPSEHPLSNHGLMILSVQLSFKLKKEPFFLKSITFQKKYLFEI